MLENLREKIEMNQQMGYLRCVDSLMEECNRNLRGEKYNQTHTQKKYSGFISISSFITNVFYLPR